MIGPALTQLFSDLAEIPAWERTEYERQLYQELKLLSEVKAALGASLMAKSAVTGDSLYSSRSYNIWIESAYPEPPPEFALTNLGISGSTENNITAVRSEGIRLSVNSQQAMDQSANLSIRSFLPRSKRVSCDKSDCPNKAQ